MLEQNENEVKGPLLFSANAAGAKCRPGARAVDKWLEAALRRVRRGGAKSLADGRVRGQGTRGGGS